MTFQVILLQRDQFLPAFCSDNGRSFSDDCLRMPTEYIRRQAGAARRRQW
ncbi:MAG: hypothetical protein ABFC89_02720 [Methanospirillum sp.]